VRDEASSGTLHRTAGRGPAKPNAGPGEPKRDVAYGVTTEGEARRDVQELAALQTSTSRASRSTARAAHRGTTRARHIATSCDISSRSFVPILPSIIVVISQP
jgi:hypothetical protein